VRARRAHRDRPRCRCDPVPDEGRHRGARHVRLPARRGNALRRVGDARSGRVRGSRARRDSRLSQLAAASHRARSAGIPTR
jgi:hypothetical protein